MRFNQVRGTLPRALFAGLSTLAFALPALRAQQPSSDPAPLVASGHPWKSCPTPCPPECATAPTTQPPSAQTPPVSPDTSAALFAPSLAPGLSAGIGGEQVALGSPGYVDSAIIRSQIRTRFDAAYGDNVPDRAEFFYAKCGAAGKKAGSGSLRAPGPPKCETNIDYQDISGYIEYAFAPRFSAFFEAPYRFLNPTINQNADGFSDINAGFKFAVVNEQNQVLTLQLRAYAPTGDAFKGLGNDHTTVDPALLWYQALSDRLALNGELRDWIPIGGTDFSGNIVRYGLALNYLLFTNQNFSIVPIGEVVGWTVLDGKELKVGNGFTTPPFATINDAGGNTIVNAKVGVRFGFGGLEERGLLSRSDVYIGYGRALTGDVWYKDILRLEYRMRF